MRLSMEMTFSQMVDCREKIIKQSIIHDIRHFSQMACGAFSKSLVTQTRPQGWSIHNNNISTV